MRRKKVVADVMTRNVATVSPWTTFKGIMRVLDEWQISAVPVVDNARFPLGVVSETDLLRKEEYRAPRPAGWLARRRRTARARAAGKTAEDIMSSPAITIHPNAPLPSAAQAMHQHGINRLVVTDDGGLVIGIVTRSDLLRVYLASDDELAERVRKDVIEFALWEDPNEVKAEVHNGIVTLTGELERRSLVSIAVQLTRAVDGVVDVIDELSWAIDDTGLRMEETAPIRRSSRYGDL